jgi:uncharacterized SAM-binding protein YcdF (DUF218 family)
MVVLAVVCCLCIPAYFMLRIYLAGQQDDLARWPGGHKAADVIIVLGASQANGRPMQVLRARLDHALDLYHDGAAPFLLFTGGKQPNDRYTEAESGRRYARAHGVPALAILLEPDGRTTLQSLLACREIMHGQHLTRAILVSDPFHAFRLRRIARDLGLHALVSPTPYSRIHSPANQLKYILIELPKYAVYRFFGV